VRAPDDEIACLAREVLRYHSLQTVAKFHARVEDAHANRPLRPGPPIGGYPIATRSGIDALATGSDGSRFKLASRTRAIVYVGIRAEPIESGGVESGALRLPHDVTVPGESIAFEGCEDRSL